MWKQALFLSAIASVCALAACNDPPPPGPTAAEQAARQQEDIAKRAQDEVGIYKPTHFTRKRLANRIGQMLDDPNLATVSYAQGIDGRLRCIGHTIGFPLPGATQTTSPTHWEKPPEYYSGYQSVQVPQPEPDQLYSPATEDATWLLLVNAKTGQANPAYFEGHVQAFTVGNKPDSSLIAQDCAD